MSITNFLYNPERKGKQQLIEEFVIRQGILSDILEDLETSSMKTPEQHYLFVGQRGTGKTTMLNRIRYAVEDSSALKSWLIPVIFSEEQYNIGDLANLWENVAQLLEDYHGFTGLFSEMEKHASYADFEERCWEILEAQLNKRGKKLVLLIDNIGDLLKKLSDQEVRRLRMILQTKPQIRLIAGSPLYLDSILDYKQPFFEFFKVIRLEDLSMQDTRELLLKLGEIYKEQDKIERIIKDTPERIETLRVLTGGVPRTIALMFNIFIEHEHENSLKDLERILDAVTPLYKHRMDDLPPQQQKIVDAVARNWDPISVKDLKDRIRLESKAISAQLRQLEKNQVIKKLETGTKNHEYILKERFFNIWYLMRYGRKDDRQRVTWLVRFLESWCTDKEIEKRISNFIEQIKGSKIKVENIDFFGEVYSSLNKLTLESKLLLQQNAPQEYGRTLQFTEDEVNIMVNDTFALNDYQNCLKWIVRHSQLAEPNKKIVIQIIEEALKNGQNLFIYTKDLSEVMLKELDAGIIPAISKFQVYQLFVIVLYNYKISMDLKNNNVEEALLAAKEQFLMAGNMFSIINKESYFWDYNFELKILLLGIRDLYFKGQINSLRKMFGESFLGSRNKMIKFSDIFNPIYLALNSFDLGPKQINLVPEKKELVLKIRDFITAK